MLDDSGVEKTHSTAVRETHSGAMRHHSKSRPIPFVSLKLKKVNRLGQWCRMLVVLMQHNV